MNSPNNKKRKSIDGFIPAGGSGLGKPSSSSRQHGSSPSPQNMRPRRRLDDFSPQTGDLNPSPIKNHEIGVSKKLDSESAVFSDKKPQKLDRWEKEKKKKKRKRIILVTIVLLLSLVGFLVVKGYINFFKALGGGGGAAALNENVDPSQLNVEGDGRINILLLGRGGAGHDGPDLTDTIILVSIDPIEKSAGIVSIPRDLYVTVPDYGSMKINSVFYSGKANYLANSSDSNSGTIKKAEKEGLNLAEQTVEDVLGIPVHYNAMINFKGFIEAIDTVGGIDINVPKSVSEHMRINNQNYFLNVKAGPKHFGGFEALAYSRSRYTSARGDFDRSERQRLVIIGLKDKILSAGTFSNPARLSQLFDQFGNNVQTSFNFEDLNKIYSIVKEIDSNKVQSIGLVDPPNNFLTTSNLGGLSVVLPTLGQDNYKDIHHYIRNTLRDSFLKQEDAGVVILNGTSQPSLALQKAEELRSYGYKVTRVDNAPSLDYEKTVLVDMNFRNNQYTKHYLQKRLNNLALDSLPDGNIRVGTNDFVIILGNDTAQ
ncbi:MAG TPA: LCP family protein [Candidatus Saccharimonadales bacterium]|nr:LCP family protein [Candidatus Saccharimonadales bacterium]